MENQEKSDFSDIFLLKSHRHVIPNLGTHRTELCQVRADFEVFEWSLTVLPEKWPLRAQIFRSRGARGGKMSQHIRHEARARSGLSRGLLGKTVKLHSKTSKSART